ncbi:MAG: 16S rRNA (guanine(966)-N(2))-methyltransferase RsmD [Candidatus Hydrogenedentes bacterium]|nr:16S rRNA (guanine(966)-N(2))-methyltransferase RsmD [Candidatus Hydrogenedentota bacterium]
MTRVTAGELRGRRVRIVKGPKTRSTAARVREALFDILGPLDTTVRFADLYAGAGIVGVESVSRGAGQCVFVEKARGPAQIIRSNMDSLGIAEKCTVYVEPVERWIRNTCLTFDIIFLDPPYAFDRVSGNIEAIDKMGLLDPAGRLVLEHSSRSEPPVSAGKLVLTRTRVYGDSALSFYEYETGF